jgi:hypothetical protein
MRSIRVHGIAEGKTRTLERVQVKARRRHSLKDSGLGRPVTRTAKHSSVATAESRSRRASLL